MRPSVELWRTGLTVLCTLTIGCAAEPAGGYGEGERDARDEWGLWSEQQQGKADRFSACGAQCTAAQCGLAWPAEARQGEPVCFARDADQDTSLAFAINGAESASFESLGLVPAPLSTPDTYMYGSHVWDYYSGTDFEVGFSHIIKAPRFVGDAFAKGIGLTVIAKRFTGPGTYTAEGLVTMSTTAKAGGAVMYGNTYRHASGCTMVVHAAVEATGGFYGNFSCDGLVAPNATTIALTGSFRIPATAIDQFLFMTKRKP